MFMHRHNRHESFRRKEAARLIDMEGGQEGIIISVLGGKNITKRLADLGLTAGTEIKIIGSTLFSGPVQVEVSGSRLVLGRGLASKITVEMK